MPLYTADALVLRTYKLGEADRIVVFLTRDRGKKRGVAKGARRPRSRFVGALEPLTEVRVAYFEKERRELVGLNYAETVRSPLGADEVGPAGDPMARDRRATAMRSATSATSPSCSTSGRRRPTPTSGCIGSARRCSSALAAGAPVEPLARYFEYWLLRLQGVYPEVAGHAVGRRRWRSSPRRAA